MSKNHLLKNSHRGYKKRKNAWLIAIDCLADRLTELLTIWLIVRGEGNWEGHERGEGGTGAVRGREVWKIKFRISRSTLPTLIFCSSIWSATCCPPACSSAFRFSSKASISSACFTSRAAWCSICFSASCASSWLTSSATWASAASNSCSVGSSPDNSAWQDREKR